MKTLFLLAAMTSAIPGWVAPDYSDLPPDLAKAALAYDEAQLRNDGPELNRLLADDYKQVSRAGTPIAFTRTEFALLEFLMRRAGTVQTRDAIIARVWSGNPDVEANTLEVFIRLVRTKIDAGRSQSLISTVRGVGYRMETEAEE